MARFLPSLPVRFAKQAALICLTGSLLGACAGSGRPQDNPLYTTAVAADDFLSFEATPAGAAVRLAWKMDGELGCDYFAVERSRDGQHFQVLDHVPGDAFAVTPLVHEYVDRTPLHGPAYYRLRQVDLDGLVHQSPVRSLAAPQDLPVAAASQ